MGASYLDTLKQAAEAAQKAETAFRREAAERIARLDQERAFAFRRLNLMRAVGEAVASAEDEPLAVGAAQGWLRARLGWSGDGEATMAALAAFAAVASAAFACREAAEEADPLAALATFEDWYRDRHGIAFLKLFEQEVPETPLVDF